LRSGWPLAHVHVASRDAFAIRASPPVLQVACIIHRPDNADTITPTIPTTAAKKAVTRSNAGIAAIAHLTMKFTIEPKGISKSVTTTRGATVASGAPQCGQEAARLDTWPKQSGQRLRFWVADGFGCSASGARMPGTSRLSEHFGQPTTDPAAALSITMLCPQRLQLNVMSMLPSGCRAFYR
jgi:hypothetical protein